MQDIAGARVITLCATVMRARLAAEVAEEEQGAGPLRRGGGDRRATDAHPQLQDERHVAHQVGQPRRYEHLRRRSKRPWSAAY